MNEVIFLVEEAGEGGYQARALEHSIFTDAVHCHFDDNEMPKMIRI